MAYNRIKNVKETAEFVADMNGVTVAELDQEDIEYIGDSCQCAYQDVAEILGLDQWGSCCRKATVDFG